MSADRSHRMGEGGAVLVETAVTILVFLTILFGVIEFSLVFYRWNAATKAVQLGARYAAVSNPVLQELPDISGLSAANPGDPYAGSYDVVCAGSGTPACTCTGSECPSTKTYNATAMNGIVKAMRKAYPSLTSKNVTVRYSYTKLGYAGRPGGPVPTITVSLTGLRFDFILLSYLLPTGITMPGFSTTVTGEDLKATWSGT